MAKERIDLLLVKKKFFPSREQAKRAIMAGLVFVNNDRVDKSGSMVDLESSIKITRPLHNFVGRGGLKLQKALEVFNLDVKGNIAIDIGASTGGFTDCLLQHGAKLVYAVDVGYGQLDWKLRMDDRVVVMERCNFRYLKVSELSDGSPNFATIDVSFISLGKIFSNLVTLIQNNSKIVALIKPQFEVGKGQVGKKGIVSDPQMHTDVLYNVISGAKELGLECIGLDYSPIQGGSGNIEFLGFFTNKLVNLEGDYLQVDKIVKDAHYKFATISKEV